MSCLSNCTSLSTCADCDSVFVPPCALDVVPVCPNALGPHAIAAPSTRDKAASIFFTKVLLSFRRIEIRRAAGISDGRLLSRLVFWIGLLTQHPKIGAAIFFSRAAAG